MKFRLFVVVVIIFSSFSYASGRKPAVEDFVGIELEDQDNTPQGTEVLFNFEKEITHYKTGAAPSPKHAPSSHWSNHTASNPSSLVALALLLGLPALSLFMVMNRFRQKAQIESASNIEVLEKYRKEREEKKAREDQERKAS